uniref:subtilisin n=1 Tax=Globisporangium ultimum (strain ATCC 200006 / CBS 805.95 / DAOM BR144) TaxID=431595 RepID=K3X3W6_GLOUD
MVFTKLTAVLALAAIASFAEAAPRVHPGVHRTLQQQGTVNIIVTMKDSPDATIQSVQEAEFATRGQQIASLVERLEKHSEGSQASVKSILSQESASAAPLYTSHESYWISNQMYFKGASFELVAKLAALPDIAQIREEQVLPRKLPISTSANSSTSALEATNEWGVTKINVPQVWATGNRGQNIVVSSIDSGVRATHQDLKGNFRSTFGWYDPEKKATTPYDIDGHGTHTMGTIAGSGGIGVAPGATWITCKGCTVDENGDSVCTESDLLSCAQFITCPTDPTGTTKDCSKAPHIVSNSWGGGQGDAFYQSSVNAWHAAGIIPIFAIGNEGPACTTASTPGDYSNVISVGATDINDGLASFSSKGPSVTGLLKPEVSAPGDEVRSAWGTGDAVYNTISGTSMATPHVSGVVALLLNANPSLKFADIKRILTTTVDTATLKSARRTCGGTRDGTFPNNNFGYGRVNALKALNSATGAPVPTSATPTTAPTPVPTTRAPTPAPNTCSVYTNRNDCMDDFNCIWRSSSRTCVVWV